MNLKQYSKNNQNKFYNVVSEKHNKFVDESSEEESYEGSEEESYNGSEDVSEKNKFSKKNLPHTSLSHCEVFEDTIQNKNNKKGWLAQLCFISDDHLKEFHLNQPYCMVFTIMLFVLSITLVEVLKYTWRTYHNEKREQIIREYEAQNNFRMNQEHIHKNKFSSISGFLVWIIEKLKNGIFDGSLMTRALQMYFPFLHGI